MKRTLSLVLALVMVLGSFSAVFAAEQTVEERAAAFLKDKEVLVGDASGDLMLKEGLKRQDAVILLSKLMGEFDEAAATKGSPTYKDITDNFYLPFLAWAQANGTFVGHSDAKFGFGDNLTAQEYASVLLRVLGYEVKWEETLEKAKELGLLADVEVEDTFLRGQMAVMTLNALGTEMKDSKETLADKLNIELPEPAKLEVKEIKANTAKSFQVTFNKAVTDEDEVKFEVKRSASDVTVTVAYDEAKQVATLGRTTALAVGDYTVKVLVKGEEVVTETIKITEQKLAKIEITSDVLAVSQDNKGYATFVAYDQYGTDVTSTYHAFGINFMTGAGSVEHKDGIITITPMQNTNLISLPNVAITGYDSTTGVSVSATLKPALSVGTLSNFELLPAEDIVVTAGDTTKVTYIPFKALDASGNETKNYKQIKEGLILTGDNKDSLTVTNNWVSVTLVQDPANSKNAAIKVVATSSTPGQMAVNIPFNITAMTKNGKVSSVTGTLVPAPSVEKLVLLPPAEVVAKNEKAVVPFEAFDANGNRLYRQAEIQEYVQFSDNLEIVTKVDGTMYLRTKSTLTQDIVVTSMVKKNGQFSTVTIRVQKEAGAETLEVKNFANALEVGVAKRLGFGYLPNLEALSYGTITVKDQYGRNIDLVLGNSNYYVKVSGGSDIVTINNNFGDNIVKGKSGIKVTAVKKGSTTLKFDLYNGTTLVDTKVVPVTVVNTSDIVNYTVTPRFSTIYTGDAAYSTTFTVRGKTVSGSIVELATASVTANPTNTTDFASGGSTVYAKASTAGYQAKDSTTDVNVSVFHNGRVTTLKTNIASSTVKPVATDIGFGVSHDEVLDGYRTFEEDILKMSVSDFNNLKTVADFSLNDGYYVEDSYSKYVMSPVAYKIVEANGITVTVNNNGELTLTGTATNGAYFTISAITSNGLVKTIRVVADSALVKNLIDTTPAPVETVTYIVDASYASEVFNKLSVKDEAGTESLLNLADFATFKFSNATVSKDAALAWIYANTNQASGTFVVNVNGTELTVKANFAENVQAVVTTLDNKEVAYGTAFADIAGLPGTVKIKTDLRDEVEVAVVWEANDYTTTTGVNVDAATLKGTLTLPAGMTNTGAIKAEIKVNVVLADGPELGDEVVADDVANKLNGLDNAMEFSIDDGKIWQKYNGTNSPDVTGDVTVQVRVAKTTTHNAGPAKTFVFTA